jgi:hypothetical protein
LDLKKVLESLRALSFGGLVAAGIGAIIYLKFHTTLGFINQYWFIGACAAIGTAAQQAIQGILTLVFKPVFGFLKFHEKILELDRLERSGRISADKHQELVDKLCEKRFLE